MRSKTDGLEEMGYFDNIGLPVHCVSKRDPDIIDCNFKRD